MKSILAEMFEEELTCVIGFPDGEGSETYRHTMAALDLFFPRQGAQSLKIRFIPQSLCNSDILFIIASPPSSIVNQCEQFFVIDIFCFLRACLPISFSDATIDMF